MVQITNYTPSKVGRNYLGFLVEYLSAELLLALSNTRITVTHSFTATCSIRRILLTYDPMLMAFRSWASSQGKTYSRIRLSVVSSSGTLSIVDSKQSYQLKTTIILKRFAADSLFCYTQLRQPLFFGHV